MGNIRSAGKHNTHTHRREAEKKVTACGLSFFPFFGSFFFSPLKEKKKNERSLPLKKKEKEKRNRGGVNVFIT